MKKFKLIHFNKHKIIKLSNKYYINIPNTSQPVVLNSIKYYPIKKDGLRQLGMKFPKKEVVSLTEEEVQAFRDKFRAYLIANYQSVAEMMVENGYKIKGFNC